MASPTVIISLDPEECLLTQPLHRRPWFGVDQLLLKRREERLSDRIVVARASTAHRALDIVRDTEISKHPGRVLRSAVGMEDHRAGGLTSIQGHLERIGNQTGPHMAVQRPADQCPGMKIE